MKKTIVISSILLLMVLFLATTQAFAFNTGDEKKPTEQTPGAKATEKAMDKGNENPGKGMGKDDDKGKKVHFKGVISASSPTSLTLTVPGGTQVFTLSKSTIIKIPTLGKTATAKDLVVGLQASVQAEKKDAIYEAKMVMVVPGKPTKVHHVGVVTAYVAGKSLTVKDKDGVEYPFILTAETKILPEERAGELVIGARVTVIFSRDLLSGTAKFITARGVVVHPAEDKSEGETEETKPPKNK